MSVVAFIFLYGVSYGLVLCLISVGLVVTMGLMRVINLAHGAFAAIGGYVAIFLISRAGLPFAAAILIAVMAITIVSVMAEKTLFVHLYTAPELDQVLLTIGVNFVVVAALTLCFGTDVYPIRLPSWLAGSVDLGFRTFEVYRIVTTAVCLIVIAALWLTFDRTNLGARLRAAVDNRSMAQATGINVPRLFTLTFAAGCGLAALGGAIGAPMLPLEPIYPFKYLVLVLVVVALSGFGNVRAVFGVSIFVGIVDTAGRFFLPDFGAFIIYILLIVLMIWRRQGLFAVRAAA